MADVFNIGGTWGDSISWSGVDQFKNTEWTDKTLFLCHGFKATHPKVGDHLLAEFAKSWITFEFVNVESCSDPQDMFFAKVKILKQELK